MQTPTPAPIAAHSATSALSTSRRPRCRVSQHDGRTWARFDRKPDAAFRAELKRQGWQWSPRRGAWSLLTH
jgi:hypothetical protein